MRIGFNPNKDKIISKCNYNHQVIVPVYIPNLEGYFKDSFKILQYCLDSLFKTSHLDTFYTIVNNGSCIEIVNYLDLLKKEGKIHELIHTTAIGKLNAILKGLTGHQFNLITIADADVLFLNNWQKATYEIFSEFPKAGVVSPSPNPKMLRYYTANCIGSTLLSKNVAFTGVRDSEAMLAFARSIGNENLYKPLHLEKNLSIQKNNVNALIGAGHFVATYKGICFYKLHKQFSNFSLGGDSEQLFLDKPATTLGLWRLSTSSSYVYHLGNVVEEWMADVINKLEKNSEQVAVGNFAQARTVNILNIFFINFFSKIIFKKFFWRLYLRYKGLNKNEASQY